MDGSRILVIDDSTTLGKLVEIAMRGTGCQVDFAATGSDGVSRARSNQPDVILLDYLLPDLRSAEVCERLRDDTATSRVPVVIMSANERSVLEDFRTFSSVVGFIGKPFTAAELRSRLEGVVRRGAKRARAMAAYEQPSLASSSTADSANDGALQLRGDLAVTPVLEVLRLLAASHATGTLVIDRTFRDLASLADYPVTARVWLRRGEILMCSGSNAESTWPGELTLQQRERVTRNLLIGKPVLVTLAEAGVARVANLPLELHAASARVLGELLDARAGRLAWEPAVSLPDFVEAFGRPVSLTAVALEHSRRTGFGARLAGVLEHVYDRSPRFSDKLAGARLSAEEQRVLALLDGQTSGREAIGRARLPADDGAAILTRLCAADLIHRELATRSAAAPTVAVLDGGGDDFVASLRARFARRSPPVEVITLDPTRSLAAATLEAHPAVVLVDVAALSQHVLEHDLPIIARDSTIAVVCVLEAPDPHLAARMLRAGLHAVIAKPVHLTEIERLLSGSRHNTQEIPCPPFS
jgi:DNA-binding response OmpR family regulator